MSNNKELEDFLNNIPGLPQEPKHVSRQHNNTNQQPPMSREIDIGNMLQQRIMQKAMQGQGLQNNGYGIDIGVPMSGMMQQAQQNKEMVYLREGQTYYKAVPAGESPMPIAILAGPIANSSGKEFINKGASKYYVVENHKPIDLSKPDYSNMRVLYAVEAPWVGTILVPESAIIRTQSSNPQGKHILKG